MTWSNLIRPRLKFIIWTVGNFIYQVRLTINKSQHEAPKTLWGCIKHKVIKDKHLDVLPLVTIKKFPAFYSSMEMPCLFLIIC